MMLTVFFACSSPRAAPVAPAVFSGQVTAIPDEVRETMVGVSWRAGCPVGLDDLSLLTVSHWDMAGEAQVGELVVASEHAEAVLGVFSALFDARFPITSMKRIEVFGGDDDASMAADNTSGFNCRQVTGGSGYSQHSYGTAIDINTVENPYVRGGRVLPAAGADFVDRTRNEPGMIVADGPVVAAFAAIGWKWGGSWSSMKDYQHFSANGR